MTKLCAMVPLPLHAILFLPVFLCLEPVPTAPSNVTILNVTSGSLHLSWQPPHPVNARISAYQLQLSEQGRAKLVRITPSPSWSQPHYRPSTVLTDLKPYTNYTVRVRALAARGNEGVWSAPVSVYTDVAAPSQPELISITCEREGALRVAWRRPFIFPHTLSAYVVEFGTVVSGSGSNSDVGGGVNTLTQQRRVVADINRPQETVVLSNLTVGQTYLVRVRSVAYSVHDRDRLFTSAPSTPERVRAEPVCAGAESTAHVWRYSGSVNGTGVSWWALLGLLVAGAILCLLVATVMILWRRYVNRSYRYREEPLSQRHLLQKEQRWESDSPDGCPAPIPIEEFTQHVAKLHTDSDIGFCKEFEEVTEHTMRLGLSAAISQDEENKSKNRYQNIDAYDHSLVPLHPLPGQRRGDYINANYVDGFRCARQYIAAQGPMCSTLHAFWRLVWEQRVHVIVMITNLVERSRKKCDLYWPSEGVESYGLIQVEALGETVLATHVVRKFRLRHIKVERRKRRDWHDRVVFQYHYTSWPDHGVPDHLLPILNFIRHSSNENAPFSSPILVHCSAGVGRTGAYIVLDAMREMLQCRRAINVFGYLKHIRSQRNFLVQTEDQYVFVHDALLELLRVGDTCVAATQLGVYWSKLVTSDRVNSTGNSLDQQYQLVRGCQPAEHATSAALAEYNRSKNRSDQFLPLDGWRVYLPHQPGVDGSGYINASIVMGYERSDEFIITQHPLSATVGDFWRMIWHQNVHTIVVLSPRNDPDYPEFWPISPGVASVESGSDTISIHRLKCILHTLADSHGSQPCHVVQLQLSSAGDESSCSLVQLVHVTDEWPAAGPTGCSPVQLVMYVQRLLQEVTHAATSPAPLVVVDRFGGTEAAQFCCLSSLYQQYNHTRSVDVYMHARLCSERRPGVWCTQEDYTMLYRTMEAAVKNIDTATSTSNKDQNGTRSVVTDPNSSLDRNISVDPAVTCDENVSLLQSSQTPVAKTCLASSVVQLPLVEHTPLDAKNGDQQTFEEL